VTLSERLRELFPGASRRSLKQWLATGRVSVNGRAVRDGRVAVNASDTVALGGRPKPNLPSGLGLVHEDDALIVIDKPPGLLTIATERERERTVYRLLCEYLAAQKPPRRPFIVHRLDRETSGLLVFAKSPAAKRRLQSQFEDRTAERIYVAVVEGRVEAERGTLRTVLAQGRALRVRPARAGREAVTHYRVLGRRGRTTALELTLGTGRRQQIRVQLAALGHPVVGDPLHSRDRQGRMRLHATRLGLLHPVTGSPVSFESAPPAGWV
jgi:23S rRNA pseudouridine1911/1915/1917 synthase